MTGKKGFDIFQGFSTENNQYKFIPLDNLIYNNEYERYEGEQYEDMVESIKKNGILIPLIVSPADEEGKYDILSGNNRRCCAEGAGLTECPCVVKEGLSDEEKQAYIDETNVFQRGFNNLKISKQAEVVARRHSSMFGEKKLLAIQREIAKLNGQDISAETENEEEVSDDADNVKPSKLAVVGKRYGLGQTTISRLVRVDKLVPELKPYLDDETLPVRAGVSLSYIPEEQQRKVAEVYAEGFRCDMKKAELIRDLSENDKIEENTIREIMSDTYNTEPKTLKSVKLKPSFIKKYFPDETDEKEVENIIEAALIQYFKRNKK